MPYVYDADYPHDRPLAEVAALIGGKAANLGVMARDLGLPVPPAFTISTEACRAYLASGWPAGLDAELRAHMARMERQVGHRFGDAADPLLVSVRSGAPISMPGMMDTILNLGLNDVTTPALAGCSGSEAFAAGCRARFDAMYRDIVGVEDVPADPWAQLRGAVEAVFRSWNSPRAVAYRRREGIPDELGTGVTVQAMVFGNRSSDSATGVLFTRNPATGEATLYGDVLFNAQGEDVVAGTHATEPITALDQRMPAVARQLREAAKQLEHHLRDLCDIEFTIECGRLWLLQCRVGKRSPGAALRMAVEMAEDPGFPLTRLEAVERVRDILADPPAIAAARSAGRTAIAIGLPASPGLAGGEIVVSPEAAVEAAAAGRTVVLVRAETSPDDVHGMSASAGVLTASGGLASHAAVVARGWGIPAVVGASSIDVRDDGLAVGGQAYPVGSPITIDGSTGEVFAGVVDGVRTVAPEVTILRSWERELDAAPDDGTSHPADTPRADAVPFDEPERDDVLVTLLVKGYAMDDALANALETTEGASRAALEGLVTEGLAERASDAFRLTEAGKSAARQAVARDTEHWGPAAAEAALDAFIGLDRRMKDIVTSWQVREVDGQQVLNDHADPAYDGAVLRTLGSLHDDATTWLDGIAGGLPRLARYRSRLARANARAQDGDGRFVASPRVDSYHSVWFELHEDLILHAGRTRKDEVKAGRA